MSQVDELRELAVSIAREAGALALQRQREGIRVAATKSAAADIVTEADREVEALVRERVFAARPADGFFGEEGGAAASDSGLTWVVDPIDGTVNYTFGMPAWAVSIAVTDATGTPVVGVVECPVLGEEFVAVRGQGATVNGEPLQVAEPPSAGAMLATGFGYDPATHPGTLATIAEVMPMARDLRRMGACSVDLAFVAAGRLDGYFERGVQPWDYSAGWLLVTEAGGTFAKFAPDAFGRDLVVAASPTVFDKLVGLLQPGPAI